MTRPLCSRTRAGAGSARRKLARLIRPRPQSGPPGRMLPSSHLKKPWKETLMIGPVRLSPVVALCLCLIAPLHAQEGQNREPPSAERQEARRPAPRPDATRLPAESVTHHSLELPGRTLRFTATAGSLTLVDPQGAPQAEIGFVSYTRDDADPATRPVTFAV